MKFNDAQAVEQVAYEMKLADWPRAQNRRRINDLFNGVPPYTQQEVEENHINVNVNSLEATRLSHEARAQYYGAFLKPGNYFNVSTDAGPAHKRGEWNSFVNGKVNKIMKRSLDYFETRRSKGAMNILHGIAPGTWRNQDVWAQDAIGIEDVMIPSMTLLTMRNLPFFALYKSLTAPELIKLTRGPMVDKAWNMPLVNRCLEWIDRESMALLGTNWPEIWSPEKAAERVKGDGGFYAADQVPTIDCWDFYFWSDEGKKSGWRRRIILDSWGTPQSSGGKIMTASRRSSAADSEWDYGQGEFLYNSKGRVFATDFKKIISFQFADLSAVAPFRYHSVRSLGYLLFAVGHLQNRMRCKFSEAVFEAMMMYFRVKSTDDAERALKVELANKGFIDDSLSFVPAADRFQINHQLVELGLSQNAQLIQEHASSWTANKSDASSDKEKTKFQVMAELNAMTTLVQASLLQSYCYQKYEDVETFRRFLKKHSTDPDVQEFRTACLHEGIPPSVLVPEAWEVEPERVMGSGNKTMEMAISEQLMQLRPMLDPEPQRVVLRDVIAAFTDDTARARSLVPEEPVKITDSVHDAQLCFTRLMDGYPVALKTGINHLEYVQSMLMDLTMTVKKFKSQGNMADQKSIIGMQTVAQNIAQHLQVLGQDVAMKEQVKKFNDVLGQQMNEVKGFAQRLEQMMKQSQGQNGNGADPKEQLKVQTAAQLAKIKQDNTKTSHAQRTAQRQVQFEQKMKQDAQRAQFDLSVDAQKHGVELQKQGREHALEVRKKNIELRSNLANDRLKRSLMESDAEDES